VPFDSSHPPSSGQRIPTYERLVERPTRQMPARLLADEQGDAFGQRADAMRLRLLSGDQPTETTPLFFALAQTPTAAVSVNLPNGGFGLLLFTSLFRTLDYGTHQLSQQSLGIQAVSPAELIGMVAQRGRSSVRSLVLDRCPRCSIFVTVEAESLRTPQRAIDWWANTKVLQHARLELYYDYAKAAAAAGDLELAREIGLEIVGHVDAEDPRPHALLGRLAIDLGDSRLLRDARGYLQFLKWAALADSLVSTAIARGLALDEPSNSSLTPPADGRSPSPATPDEPTATAAPVVPRDADWPNRYGSDTIGGLSAGDLMAQTFRVKRVCRGGMGVVYLTEFEPGERVPEPLRFLGGVASAPAGDRASEVLGRHWFAIKMLGGRGVPHELQIQQFERECLVWCTLTPHPNVVRAFTIDRLGGLLPFVVLEYVPGGNLRDAMRRGSNLAGTLRTALHICRGMAFLDESAGIVHRDLKPENILIDEGGMPKITDFGLVQFSPVVEPQAGDGPTTMPVVDLAFTNAAGLAGSIPYMAPEQFLGLPLDRRSDVYSFGVVLFEMLAGRRPFEAADFMSYQDCHLNETPPRLTDLAGAHTDLAAIVSRCLVKAPEKRFQNFRALSDALAEFCCGHLEITLPAPLWAAELQRAMTASDWQGRGQGLLMMAETLIARGQRPEAKAILEQSRDSFSRATDDAPVTRLRHAQMGRVLHLLGRPEDAVAHFQQAMSLGPAAPETTIALSESLEAVGDIDGAADVLRIAAARAPNDQSLRLRRFMLLSKHGAPAAAKTAFFAEDTDQSKTPDRRSALPWWKRWFRSERHAERQPPFSPNLPGWILAQSDAESWVWRDRDNDALFLHLAKGTPNAAELTDEQVRRQTARGIAQAQGAGLIEVGTIPTGRGRPVAWAFSYKTSSESGFGYRGMMFVHDGLSLQVWTVAASERGEHIGAREAAVSAEFLNNCRLTADDYFSSWNRDPYEPRYAGVERSALRSIADDERYDERFPDHPLSKVRRLLKMLPETISRP
jgi:serine/threonine protein kinase